MRKLKNIELNRKDITEFKKSQKTKLTIILDNIRSLNILDPCLELVMRF